MIDVSVFCLSLSPFVFLRGLQADNYATDTCQDQTEPAPTGTLMAL